MRTIIVDDEPIMVKSFLRLSADIEDIDIVGQFTSSKEALEWAKANPVDLVFLDIEMPEMNGIELASKLREIKPDILLVFISAYDDYIRDANAIGADYYIVKPYKRETIEMTMDRLRLLAKRQTKRVLVQTFGHFTVFIDDRPIELSGKAKEILALVIAQRGQEISNEDIYRVIWPGREHTNENMKVYYNALRRLKASLAEVGLSNILISLTRGQAANTEAFECDCYKWIDGGCKKRDLKNQFMTEYDWAQGQLSALMKR